MQNLSREQEQSRHDGINAIRRFRQLLLKREGD